MKKRVYSVSLATRGVLFTLLVTIAACLLLISSLQLTGCGTTSGSKPEAAEEEPVSIEDKWGVQISPVRLTAQDFMLDFRYRVIDPDKATALMKRGDDVYLIDHASGMRMPVPVTKVGPMRASGYKPKEGRQYVVLFSNLGRKVQKGSEVTVVIGEFRAENLVVQ